MHIKDPQRLQTARIVCLCALSCVTMASYAFARAAIESIFLQEYSSHNLPYVWLITPLVAAGVIMIYNRYNGFVPLLKIFSICTLLSILISLFLAAGLYWKIPGSAFLLYIWKDVYIVLLVEIFWSYSDIVFHVHPARWIYGLLLAMGSIGSLGGGLLAREIVQSFHTQAVLWCTFPCSLLSFGIAHFFEPYIGDYVPEKMKYLKTQLGQSARIVWKSAYLTPLLCLIVLIQIYVTLVDYEFNNSLQLYYPDMDVRTQVAAQVYAAVDALSFFAQILTGPILRLTGVGNAMVGIPIILCCSLIIHFLVPQFKTIMILKVISKVFDYSLLKATKEIVYIPLSRLEKTQGKAFIDIFMFRTAKAFSSLIVLGIVALAMPIFILWAVLGLLFAWISFAYTVAKRYSGLEKA